MADAHSILADVLKDHAANQLNFISAAILAVAMTKTVTRAPTNESVKTNTNAKTNVNAKKK